MKNRFKYYRHLKKRLLKKKYYKLILNNINYYRIYRKIYNIARGRIKVKHNEN